MRLLIIPVTRIVKKNAIPRNTNVNKLCYQQQQLGRGEGKAKKLRSRKISLS